MDLDERAKKGRQAAVDGSAHEHIVAGLLMKKYKNVSLVDLALSSYDIIIVKHSEDHEDIIRGQIKTATRSISFKGGSRGGVDRKYVSDIKHYKYMPEECDVIIGIHPKDENSFDLYFVPTSLVLELKQNSISINKIKKLKNNYEILENCKNKNYVLDKCCEYKIL